MKTSLLKRLLILTLAALFSACTSIPRQSTPAPVEKRDAVEQGGAQVSAYRPPQHVAVIRPQTAKAVQLLKRRAADQSRAGNYTAAAVSLERGLRIEPRNASLWNQLAHVRASQKQYSQVVQFAAKSNALLRQNAALNADNWALIAQARAALGDPRGAAKARAKARLIQ